MNGMETEIQIELRWSPVMAGEDKPYRFPLELTQFMRDNYSRPGVYRWAFDGPAGKLESAYIGEAQDLVDRWKGFRKPGPSQVTNKRVHALLQEALLKGYGIRLETLSFPQLKIQGVRLSPPDLRNPYARKLMENLAILDHIRLQVRVLNLAGNATERRIRRILHASAS